MNATREQWRPVVGWENLYEVSDMGQVRTITRIVSMGRGWRRIPSKVRRQSRTTAGYPTITLSGGSRVVTRLVHKLVLEAFVGPRPEGMEACHYDGDKANNALSNLRWDTKHANDLDAVRVGKRPDPKRDRCGHGHELTPDNTFVTKARPNTRQCKKCLSVINARARAKRRSKPTSHSV